MNRKPSWGLWLLMIVAPVAVFGGIRYWKSLPPPLSPQALEMAAQGTPLIGELQIVTVQGKPTSYGTMILLCNPKREKLSVSFIVESGASELLKYPKGASPIFRDGSPLGTYFTGNGILYFGIVDINRSRTKPIRLKLNWKHGHNSGSRKVVITPQMKP